MNVELVINSDQPIRTVIPVKAGIQERNGFSGFPLPAFAGMTDDQDGNIFGDYK